MKYGFLLILIVNSINCFSQSDLKQIEFSDIPKGIQDIGVISNAVRWTDSLGDNILITTKKEIVNSSEKKNNSNGTLFNKNESWFYGRETEKATKLTLLKPSYTLHYFVKNDSAILTWQVMGIIKYCNNDDNLNLAKNWFVVTDLDKDNLAEAWIIYKSVCPQDEGEDTGIIQIIMYENEIRSTIRTSLKKESFHEGALDYNFQSCPEIFKKYAIQLWKKFANTQ